MRVYQLRCPHCNKVVESGVGVSPGIGAPVGECKHCGKAFLTGRTYWAIMNEPQRDETRRGIVRGSIGFALKLGVIVAIVVGAFAHEWAAKSLPDFELLVTWAAALGVVAVSVLLAVLRIPAKVRGIQKWEPSAEEKALAERFFAKSR